ncbi:MAG: putative rane protein [Devosia sp.]|nr:putative rane protein [Devosia sp.]
MIAGTRLLNSRLGKNRIGLSLLGAISASLAFFVTPAHADLRICNETTNLVSVSLGYRAERGWMSEGWWQAPPGDCRVLYQGDLVRRFYYLFAVDDIGGGAWDGSVFMCTRDETFTIFGVEDCLARGYERTGFFEIDTQNRTDWTLQLTDGAGGPAVVGPDGNENLEDPTFLVDPDDVTMDAPQDDITTPGTDKP